MSVKNKHFRSHARRVATAAIELLGEPNCCPKCSELDTAEAAVVAHEAAVRYLAIAGLDREVDLLHADPVYRTALRELAAAERDPEAYRYTASYLVEQVDARWDEITIRASELYRAEAPAVAA